VALKQRGGVWWFVKKIKGHRYRKSTEIPIGTKAQREAAERRASEIELQIRSGEFGWTKDVPTLGEWWATYEETYTSRKGAPERDRQVMTHALAFFGADRPIDEIKKSDCLKYLAARRVATQANPGRKTPGTISENTVQRERSFLQALWNQAIEDGHEMKNPWKGIERRPYDVRDRVLLDEEQTRLLAVLSPKFQRFLLFLLGTGVRLDECRGIIPDEHLDLKGRTVKVRRKFGKVQTLPLTEDVVRILEAQLEAEGELWTQNPQRLREVLAEGAKRAKIPHLGPHTMRHTFGWRWLRDGGDIYKLSKILGHASVAVTERHYAHLLKEDLSAAVNARNMGIGVSVRAVVSPTDAVPEIPAAPAGSNVLRGKFGARTA
jgi:integrase